MYIISPKTMRKREKITEILLVLKAAGYQTFIGSEEDYAFGMVEKDGHIVGIEGATYGIGLHFSYKYRPGREHGSCVGYGDADWGCSSLTEEDIRECIRYGSNYVVMHELQRYRDVQEYLKHYDLYVPI